MKKPVKDIAASVRARLLRVARERGEDFQRVLTQFANERLLFRLASSPHASRFVLKGATLFAVWTGRFHRPTRDVDLLGHGDATETSIRRVFGDVIAAAFPDDGIAFDASTLRVVPIHEDGAHGGLRVTVDAVLAVARVPLQIDVGFGDVITPAASQVALPVLLDFPAPRLRAYPRETVVAEKVEAMVRLGLANSRMKDFYDLAVLGRMFDFEGAVLVKALRATFQRRVTALPTETPVGLTRTFADDAAKRAQWTAFVRKGDLSEAADLPTLIAEVRAFVGPALEAARGGTWSARWTAPGPWAAR